MTDVKSEEGQSRSGPDAFKKDFARMDRPVVHRFMDRPVVHEDENVEEKNGFLYCRNEKPEVLLFYLLFLN